MPELRLPVRRGRRRVLLWLVVGLGLLIFFISPLVGLLAEWPWVGALGYHRVFATPLVASFTLGVWPGAWRLRFCTPICASPSGASSPTPWSCKRAPRRRR